MSNLDPYTAVDVTRAFDVPLLHLMAFAYANET